MKDLKTILEASLLDIDGIMKEGDKYNKDITAFFDEIDKHLKNANEWNVKYSFDNREWVCYSFSIPMNETVLKLIEKPLKLRVDSYKIENLYIDISILWKNQYTNNAMCYIKLMSKSEYGSEIIVRHSGKRFKPNFNNPDIHDNKIMINKMLKPAIKNIFKPALNNIDTLIEFMTTYHD